MAKWAISENSKAFSESWPVNTGLKNQAQRPEAALTEVECHHYAWSKPRGPLVGYQSHATGPQTHFGLVVSFLVGLCSSSLGRVILVKPVPPDKVKSFF